MHQEILRWYKTNKRDLPWRKTTDIYKILVSEIMLQQTQVDRVIPYYKKFLKRFPNAKSLAEAPLTDVLQHWSGLGYNRRGVMLQKASQALTKHVPKTIEELETLPGIGPYTARAIAAFAWNQSITATDTNIRRIFSRYCFKGQGTLQKIDRIIQKNTPQEGRDWNNALMDLGSTICTASNPKCTLCPLQKTCTAFNTGNQERYFRIAPPQKKFEGSQRQYRGAIIKLLLEKSLTEKQLITLLKKQALENKTLQSNALKNLVKEQIIQENKNTYSIRG